MPSHLSARSPRITTLIPSGVTLNEDALARHEPLLRGLRARIGRLTSGPLARRRMAPPRPITTPTTPRLRWQTRGVPFTRSAALGSTPFRVADTLPLRAPKIASFPAPDAAPSPASRRKQRP